MHKDIKKNFYHWRSNLLFLFFPFELGVFLNDCALINWCFSIYLWNSLSLISIRNLSSSFFLFYFLHNSSPLTHYKLFFSKLHYWWVQCICFREHCLRPVGYLPRSERSHYCCCIWWWRCKFSVCTEFIRKSLPFIILKFFNEEIR